MSQSHRQTDRQVSLTPLSAVSWCEAVPVYHFLSTVLIKIALVLWCTHSKAEHCRSDATELPE
jgi:hypothetical protein